MVPRRDDGLKGDPFVHLHVRSGFSFGFGVARPEELMEAAAEMGMPSLALTDRDGLYGIPRFLESAGEVGILPIVGAEISTAEGHIVLLAESIEGYRSLCRLVTEYRTSSEDRRRPLCPVSAVVEHTEGVICLTGAIPFGLLPRLVLKDRRQEAMKVLRSLSEAFGGDRLYVELTDDQTSAGRRNVAKVAAFARDARVPTVATGEVAYLFPGDHRLHEVLVASANLTALPGPEYRPTDRLHLRSGKEMQRLFAGYPHALANAAAIAERCAGTVKLSGAVHMPQAILPPGKTAGKTLLELTVAGARRRYGWKGGPTTEEIKARLRRELGCIEALGFAPYFLIAHEAKEIAKARGIPVTGRGSAANSLVSYCLGLTQPEPFGNRLLFERFMHEERRDPPDIDLDFCSLRRDEVRFEMIRRYEERLGVAEAATVQTMSLRGAVRVAARALGHSPDEINELSRHVPTRFRDRNRTYAGLSGWEEALAEPAMKGHPLQDVEKHRLLLELSSKLAGRIKEGGTHSGGMVFGTAEHHLSELVPLEPSGTEGLLRCQYDKDDLERVGLPKLDLLGLRMHTALYRAGVLVSERLGKKVDPYDLPPEDKKTYALIRTGRNAGMFQLESPGQMHLSRRLGPWRFSDLVAQISLFRPGPVRGDLVTPYVMRKNGREPYEAILPELKEVLHPTYGVLVYQEQVLAVANTVAGFTLAEGDLLRRAMTKDRGPGAMRELRREFLRRARERGVPVAEADQVFSWMENFSVYGFSAAHAGSFADLAYASAYMRCHYPAEFLAAVLDSQPMGFYSPRLLLNEARRIRLRVLPPDVHLSGEDFTVEEGGTALRVGLRYCKGLSEKAISSIVAERHKRPFISVADLYGRTAVEKDSLESLIRGGFLDPLAEGFERARLLGEIETLPKKRRGSAGQPEIPVKHPASWWAAREKRNVEHLPLADTAKERMEWEVLGLNVHRHPLMPYRNALQKLGVVPSERIMSLPHGTSARAAGLIECLQNPPTKSGHRVYFLLIEDEWGLLQATIFRSVYERYGHVLHGEGAFLMEGRVEQTIRKGFAFLVHRVRSLQDMLLDARVPVPRVASAPGAFLRAGRRSRKAS